MLLAVLAVLFISTFVRSAFGFGDAVLAMPLLVLFIDLKTATPLVALAAGTIALCILISHWKNVRIESAWRLVLSSLAGIPLGLYLLNHLNEELMKLLLAGLIILFALINLTGPQRLVIRSERYAYLFGFTAGVFGGAYNTNGPPVVLYGLLRRWSPGSFRATLQGDFLPTGLLILIGHGISGLWTGQVLFSYLCALPVILPAIWIGAVVNRTIPEGKFDRIIYLFLLLIGCVLVRETIRNGLTT